MPKYVEKDGEGEEDYHIQHPEVLFSKVERLFFKDRFERSPAGSNGVYEAVCQKGDCIYSPLDRKHLINQF